MVKKTCFSFECNFSYFSFLHHWHFSVKTLNIINHKLKHIILSLNNLSFIWPQCFCLQFNLSNYFLIIETTLLLGHERMGPTIMAKLLLVILLWAENFATSDKCLRKCNSVDLIIINDNFVINKNNPYLLQPACNIHSLQDFND